MRYSGCSSRWTRAVSKTLSFRQRILANPWVQAFERSQRASHAMRQVKVCLSPKQAEVVDSESKRIASDPGRRGGKTVSALAKLVINGADYPGALSAYAAISVGRAIEILEPAIRVIERAGCPLKRGSRQGLLYLTCPNGHRIWITGVPHRRQVDSLRGNPLVGFVADEAYSMDPYLEEMIDQAVEPALLDFDGWLMLIGSPGPVPVGYFYSALFGQNDVLGWEHHHWDVRDNVHIRHAARWLEEVKARHRWTDETPQFAREYLGLWVVDPTGFCYPYDPALNSYTDADRPAEGEWRSLISCDPGVVDDAAMVRLRWRHGFSEIWTDDSFTRPGMSPSGFGAKVLEWRATEAAPVVADTGGIGRAFTEEWAQRYGLTVEAASKSDVRGQIAVMAGEMKAGLIKAHSTRCRDLIDQWRTIAWDDDRKGHDDRYADHLADAERYGVMHIRAMYKPETEKPKPGSEEWQRQQDEAERAEKFKRAAQRRRRESQALWKRYLRS
jgi:hypothetical protein